MDKIPEHRKNNNESREEQSLDFIRHMAESELPKQSWPGRIQKLVKLREDLTEQIDQLMENPAIENSQDEKVRGLKERYNTLKNTKNYLEEQYWHRRFHQKYGTNDRSTSNCFPIWQESDTPRYGPPYGKKEKANDQSTYIQNIRDLRDVLKDLQDCIEPQDKAEAAKFIKDEIRKFEQLLIELPKLHRPERAKEYSKLCGELTTKLDEFVGNLVDKSAIINPTDDTIENTNKSYKDLKEKIQNLSSSLTAKPNSLLKSIARRVVPSYGREKRDTNESNYVQNIYKLFEVGFDLQKYIEEAKTKVSNQIEEIEEDITTTTSSLRNSEETEQKELDDTKQIITTRSKKLVLTPVENNSDPLTSVHKEISNLQLKQNENITEAEDVERKVYLSKEEIGRFSHYYTSNARLMVAIECKGFFGPLHQLKYLIRDVEMSINLADKAGKKFVEFATNNLKKLKQQEINIRHIIKATKVDLEKAVQYNFDNIKDIETDLQQKNQHQTKITNKIKEAESTLEKAKQQETTINDRIEEAKSFLKVQQLEIDETSYQKLSDSIGDLWPHSLKLSEETRAVEWAVEKDTKRSRRKETEDSRSLSKKAWEYFSRESVNSEEQPEGLTLGSTEEELENRLKASQLNKAQSILYGLVIITRYNIDQIVTYCCKNFDDIWQNETFKQHFEEIKQEASRIKPESCYGLGGKNDPGEKDPEKLLHNTKVLIEKNEVLFGFWKELQAGKYSGPDESKS